MPRAPGWGREGHRKFRRRSAAGFERGIGRAWRSRTVSGAGRSGHGPGAGSPMNLNVRSAVLPTRAIQTRSLNPMPTRYMPTRPMPAESPEARISELASHQHGLVTRSQLLDVGISSSSIQRRQDRGQLRAIHKGVYRVGPLESPRTMEMAAVLAGGPSALLSHMSAASLWDFVRIPPPSPVHITVPEVAGRRREGIVFHWTRGLAEDEVSDLGGLPVTSPSRTIIDIASDLGRREMELVLARAEDQGRIDRASLGKMVDRYHRQPGVGLIRELFQSGEDLGLTRSEAERRCLELIRSAGLPKPHTNVLVGPYELDLFWPDLGIALEIDGWAYHSSRRRFEGDRRKDNWLRSRGIEVIRLTWRQITHDATTSIVQVGQALALAQARRNAINDAERAAHSTGLGTSAR